MQRKYFSVVFEVLNDEQFQNLSGQLTAQMAADNKEFDKALGHSIVACGWGDFATQADAFRQHLEGDGYNAEEVMYNFIDTEDCDLSHTGVQNRVKEVMG